MFESWRRWSIALGVCALIGGVQPAWAQVNLNEAYISHTGVDDQEFIELIGAGGTNLTDVMILVVEGELVDAGTLDLAIDLTGQSIPVDGYFVLGNTAVANLDLDIGSDNNIENGTETIYLIEADNVSAVLALVGTDLDSNDDGVYDAGMEISSLGTILDVVGVVDGDFGVDDVVYDNPTTVGPDGTFFPAGIFRDADFPNDWCDSFLDFDDVANTTQPRTPGAANSVCPSSGASGACCLNGNCYEDVLETTCLDNDGDYQGDDSTCDAVNCNPPAGVTINEVRIDSEVDEPDEEYFELTGAASASLNDLTYIVIGEDFDQIDGSGVIEAVVSLAGQSIQADGYFVAAEATFTLGTTDLTADLTFENSDNVTHLLVRDFTGALDDDLDTDDDGVLDTTPWSEVIDCIALIETIGTGDLTYCAATAGPDGSFVPGHAYRCGDGGGAWQIGAFFTGDGDDTVGADNLCGACCDGGDCTEDRAPEDCANGGGNFQGSGSDCTGDPCATGACCVAGVCEDGLDESGCIAGGGTFTAGMMCMGVTCPTPPSVVISEIMYNPNSAEGIPNQVEYVELYNTGGSTVSIENWFLMDEDGMTAAFPLGTEIDPGEAVVIIPNDQTVVDFQDAWGAGYQIIAVGGWGQPGLSSLSNSPSATNEILTLVDGSGVAVDVVNFDDEGDWPSDAIDGPSIRALCTALDPILNNDGTNWILSALGVNGAINNVVTADFNGTDTGSPGVVVCPEEPVGACCEPDETCFETTEAFCDDQGFTYFGDDTLCADITCPPIGGTGACCTEGDCTEVSQLVCESGGGSFLGAGLTCMDVTIEDCPAGSPLIISEVVEGTLDDGSPFGPSNQPRFVELTNVGCLPINMAAYSIGNFNNGGTTLGGGSATQLSGTLAPGESFIFAYDVDPALVFETVYSFSPDAFAGGGFINGNDNIALFRGVATGMGLDAVLVDVYGRIGEAGGSGDFSMDWAYEDTVARRNASVLAPNALFEITEWTVGTQGDLQGADDNESTTLLQTMTDPGDHDFNDPCAPGGIAPPLPERHFDGNPTPPGGAGDPALNHTCASDVDCANQGSGAGPNAHCLTGADSVQHCYVAKNRVITVEANPANDGVSHSLRVTWDQGGGVFVPVGFVDADAIAGTNSPAPHRLQTTPDPIDWNASFARVHITGCAIVPGATYRVQALPQGADPMVESNYSAPVELYTSAVWGDVTGSPIVTGAAAGPDNFANLGDVLDAVLAAGGTPTAPSVWFDVEGGGTTDIDNFTNLADALQLLGAVTSPYPFDQPGDPGCPLP